MTSRNSPELGDWSFGFGHSLVIGGALLIGHSRQSSFFARFSVIRMQRLSMVELNSVGRSVVPGQARQRTRVSPSNLKMPGCILPWQFPAVMSRSMTAGFLVESSLIVPSSRLPDWSSVYLSSLNTQVPVTPSDCPTCSHDSIFHSP